MKRKLLSVLMSVAVIAAFVTGCGSAADTKEVSTGAETETGEGGGSAEASNEGAVKIVAIGVQSGGSYWGNIEKGFTQACTELGWQGDYWTPQNAGNDGEMVQLAENAITQGYDAICMEINDLDMYGDIITRAKEAGIRLISMTDIGEENCDAFVGIDSYAAGYSQGEKIGEFAVDLSYDEVNYVTLMSATDNASQLKYRQGIADGIAASFTGGVNEIEIAATDSNAATAQDKLNAFYLANPQLNAVGCTDLYGALGAAQFVQENGLGGKFIVTGLELTADSFKRVLDGDLMVTSSVDSVGIGKNFCYVAQKMLNGEAYDYSNPADKIWVMPDEVEAYCTENNIELD